MRRRINPVACLLIGATSTILVCGILWSAAVFLLGLPQAESRLGPASPSINPIYRSFLSSYLLVNESALDQPAGDLESSIVLTVQAGSPASVVVDQLINAGIVDNGFLFRSYLRYRGFDRGIEAGNYQVHGGMTVRDLAKTLQTAQPLIAILTVLEGWRLEEIAGALPTSGLSISETEFWEAAHTSAIGFTFAGEIPDPPSLEGFLFPDTYFLDPDATAIDATREMLANFDEQVTYELRAGFARQGLSLFEAITLASIVEREAVVSDEKVTIASVFLNRLANNMPLDADPTVQYALGQQADGWWKAPLSFDDLEVDSPYNTYRYPGLPPGPIANPGLVSLEAVAFPDQTTFLYFRALCDGSGRHAFARTFEEHVANACP